MSQVRLNAQELELNEQKAAFHLDAYTSAMLGMRRDAASPEQQAAIERLYLERTGKNLKDVLEERIIQALKAKYS